MAEDIDHQNTILYHAELRVTREIVTIVSVTHLITIDIVIKIKIELPIKFNPIAMIVDWVVVMIQTKEVKDSIIDRGKKMEIGLKMVDSLSKMRVVPHWPNSNKFNTLKLSNI